MTDKERVTEDTIAQTLAGLVRRIEGSPVLGLQALAQRQARKRERRYAVAERLAQHLPEDDPRLISARQAARQAEELELATRQQLRRTEKQPEVGPDDWAVTGHVRLADGKPAAGVVVRVYDAEGKHGDLLGSATTDESGDFALAYDTCRLRERMGEESPDLYVRIEGEKGQVLIRSETPIRFEGGMVEHFEIALPAAKGKREKRDT